jgi:multidrug efflux pump subunit AcrA (membrane-fusion protein)
VRLPNDGGELVGGLFARGRILLGRAHPAVVVPIGAVRETPDGTHVLMVGDGCVHFVPVTVGDRDTARGLVEIVSGVSVGDTVVVSPGELEDGAAVRIDARAPEATPPTGGAASPGGDR